MSVSHFVVIAVTHGMEAVALTCFSSQVLQISSEAQREPGMMVAACAKQMWMGGGGAHGRFLVEQSWRPEAKCLRSRCLLYGPVSLDESLPIPETSVSPSVKWE